MNIPSFVSKAIEKIECCGFEAYAVGGCVRDILMNKYPSDWDLTTSAHPNDIQKIFDGSRIIPTGIRHGTLTVIIDGHKLEITTFRIDGDYLDSRRPSTVTFTNKLDEDLSRRDFTVNSLAYSPRTGLVDLFGGKEDIKNRLIRCVGAPEERFHEDALRIMRALRFAAVLGFDIDTPTADAIVSCRSLLANISAERITSELNKILTSENPAPILSQYYSVFTEIIPELSCASPGFPGVLEALADIKPDLCTRLTAFLCCADKFTVCPDAVSRTLRALKYNNSTVQTVGILISFLATDIKADKIIIKKLLNQLGAENLRRLIDIKLAFSDSCDERRKLIAAENICSRIIADNECFTIRSLAVRGLDLIDIGVPKGKEIGNALNLLLDSVIEEKCSNDKNELLRFYKHKNGLM